MPMINRWGRISKFDDRYSMILLRCLSSLLGYRRNQSHTVGSDVFMAVRGALAFRKKREPFHSDMNWKAVMVIVPGIVEELGDSRVKTPNIHA